MAEEKHLIPRSIPFMVVFISSCILGMQAGNLQVPDMPAVELEKTRAAQHKSSLTIDLMVSQVY